MVILFVALALAADYELPPEPEGVGEIRAIYNEVKAGLEDEYGLYRTEISVNATDLPYPALGDYRQDIVLHWWSEAGEDGLVLAVHEGVYAAHHEYTEVLFDGYGTVLFCLYAWDNGTGDRYEVRRWYEDGSEIHAMSCRITVEGTEFLPPSEDDLIREPEYYQELFDLL